MNLENENGLEKSVIALDPKRADMNDIAPAIEPIPAYCELGFAWTLLASAGPGTVRQGIPDDAAKLSWFSEKDGHMLSGW